MIRYLFRPIRLPAKPFSNAIRQSSRNGKYLGILLFSSILVACGGGGGEPTQDFTVFGAGGLTGTAGSGTGTGTTDLVVYRIGSGIGAAFANGVATASDTNLEAGESTTITVNIVDALGNASTEGANVAFSSPCVSSGLASFSTTPVSTATGQAQTTYTAFGCSGTDVITATLQESGVTASVTLTIAPNQVISVSFDSATKFLVEIGGQDTAELTFLVSGAGGAPVIGEDVTFTIGSAPGGVTILSGRDTDTTDNDGKVTTVIKGGTVQGTVSIIATHDSTGIQGTSDDIIISTGVPDSAFFSLSSSVINPPNAFNTDAIEVSFSIIASDQFGNNPVDGTRVSFVSPEAGNITNSCELSDGVCSVVWRSSATRPADMRVGIIAYTDGAEAFTDANGNAVYDAGDPVPPDLPEPYVDEDESGAYDVGEYFFDFNTNGIRDTGNGEWDGPCLSAVNAAALCTGLSATTIAQTSLIVMSTNTPRLTGTGSTGNFGAVGSTITVPNGTDVSRSGMFIADSNAFADALGGNPMPAGTTSAHARHPQSSS